MTKTYYYGSDYSQVAIEYTEVHVEINMKEGNRYTLNCIGENAPIEAIDFVNSIKALVGKKRIAEIRVGTSLFTETKDDE